MLNFKEWFESYRDDLMNRWDNEEKKIKNFERLQRAVTSNDEEIMKLHRSQGSPEQITALNQKRDDLHKKLFKHQDALYATHKQPPYAIQDKLDALRKRAKEGPPGLKTTSRHWDYSSGGTRETARKMLNYDSRLVKLFYQLHNAMERAPEMESVFIKVPDDIKPEEVERVIQVIHNKYEGDYLTSVDLDYNPSTHTVVAGWMGDN